MRDFYRKGYIPWSKFILMYIHEKRQDLFQFCSTSSLSNVKRFALLKIVSSFSLHWSDKTLKLKRLGSNKINPTCSSNNNNQIKQPCGPAFRLFFHHPLYFLDFILRLKWSYVPSIKWHCLALVTSSRLLFSNH